MNLKEQIINYLKESGIKDNEYKIVYHEQSPYQKRRYKDEFVEQECWLYKVGQSSGYCITEEEFKAMAKDKEYYSTLKMLGEEIKEYRKFN